MFEDSKAFSCMVSKYLFYVCVLVFLPAPVSAAQFLFA